MQPARRPQPQALDRRLRLARAALSASGLALAAMLAPAAAAQDASINAESSPDDVVRFEADKVRYDSNAELVTATGNVVLRHEDQTVRADNVTWDRNSGQIVANGNIRFVDVDGNVVYTEKVELTDEFKAGAIEDLLVVLRSGGRLAAERGSRDAEGNMTLETAAYSGCAVEDEKGCPRKPSWEVTATRVYFDAKERRVKYKGATLHLFGVPILPLPGLGHTSDFRAETGLLIPDFRLGASNGAEISETWYWRIADNRDLAVTGTFYTGALPMLTTKYRHLTDLGAFQITGYATRSSRIPLGSNAAGTANASQQSWRGYVDSNGKLQFSPEWSLTGNLRLASDRTFLRRYDISRDDRLRSSLNLERISPDSYLSIAGWVTQTVRVNDPQGMVPLALPAIDYRRRLAFDGIPGRFELEANSLAIVRTAGQDSQRAFARAQWDLRTITGMGQEVTLTGLLRGDVYHSSDNELTTTEVYRGLSGWQTRGIATAALDVKWPFVGEVFGGSQVLTPRFQVVATPGVRNFEIPNEDSRSVDLEDTNLFALNRFPGHDRIEDGVRFTYGFDWQFQRPGLRVATTIGQSYRLSSQKSLLPEGTGLTSRASDYVGRTTVRFGDVIKFTHRFRLDKDSLALRRNEFDATLGDHRRYVEVGYLKLNRNIASTFEDLQDREELRFAARTPITRTFSVFASGIVNLTDRNEDPTLTSDGFQMLRHRIGVAYTDDCLDLSFTWRRDYVTTGDAARGNSFQVSLSLKNLGVK
ncbi:organic solvent tolerance protein [Novosphingobium aromaticivorans DSM 12444]|uniref:LPS-assembly protein LptD n=1 Tax=Novosphingobium aromaticivorans (strain ATCC 700278 / DSM 12444 / CCUG 56034 / CIP 105152 / NBRC 16084 / F199) TaxID=279238 RepID=Q2G9Y9_NOVAD|nr:LPS assembly protein LptD [Novosphingobium aromaticivorans]ABD25334.1 organic solvent tolerance protein [Novosphingobium aromaticivorans DSM 12444]SCX90304.1 LPS-assembly protein [Novosphingobium aromaticivorans]